MGTLYFKQYKIDQFIKTNIEAAKLYGIKNRHIPEIKSYANALDGYIILNDKQLADSVMSICTGLVKINPELAEHLHSSFISYIIEFGTPEETKDILEELEDSELESEDIPNIAKAYTKLGHYDKAHKFITSQKTEGSILDSLKYLSIETMILEKQGKFESALNLFRKYSSMLERYQYHLMSQDLMFAEERHQSELNTMANLHDKDKIIYWSLCVAFAMLLLTCWLYYSYRLLKSRRVITEKENENLRLEKVNLLTQKENAELERDKKILEADNLEKDRRHLEAEQRQKILENENLRLELERIEGERDSLKELIKDRPSLDPSLREVIKNRLTILNSLLAKEITNVEKYAGPYKKLIEAAKVDKEEFINSTRLVYTVSHPNFMAYLTSLGLSINELNYISLYAMGIRGKEVGQYVNLKRHYNVSSDIRKKLGINEHETNLGKYIQRLMEELDPPLRPSKPVC